MFKRHTTSTLISTRLMCLCLALVLVLDASLSMAAAFVCAEDLDGDGDLTTPGETASCILPLTGEPLCPINAVDCEADITESCPVAGVPCVNGVCQSPARCEVIDAVGGFLYFCPTLPGRFLTDDAAVCNAACSNATQACISQTSNLRCPLGDQYACINNGGSFQCNANACVDLASSPPVDSDIPATMLIDDGDRDQNGNCLGSTIIFSGRGMQCLPSGVSTAFKNCCDFDGEIYTDSTGSVIESTLTNTAILATFQAATAAYGAYGAALSSGATTAAAGDAAASAASDVFAGAFDPTTLVIAIAIALILDWLASACPQESLEAAALMASDYCVELGSYCKKSWLSGCVQRARVQCCFNSKLARIIHEQGRPQLSAFANGFGTPEAPDCRGFSPQEFQALDFSKIDLSEYYADVRKASDEAIQQSLQDGVERFNETLGSGS